MEDGSSSSQLNLNHGVRLSLIGALCGVGAALGYTLASTCLRSVATDVDSIWVTLIKASTNVAIFGPYLAYLWWRGAKIWPPAADIGRLVAVAVFVQLAGNLAFQLALGKIGMALTVPLFQATMVISGATLGYVVLGEYVRRITAIALSILVASVAMLSLGGKSAFEQMSQIPWESMSAAQVAIAVGLACVCGFSYALLGVVIRMSMKHHIPLATPMVIVGAAGVSVLGTMTVFVSGVEVVWATTSSQWIRMLGAGLANAGAFLLLTKSFKHLPVVYVNAINLIQVALAVLIGIAFFGEAFTPWLAAGYLAMCGGFLLLVASSIFKRRSRVPTTADNNSNNRAMNEMTRAVDDDA